MSSRANVSDPVSEFALKRLAGEFDLEGIRVLDLSDRGLASYGAIPRCIGLCVLNLSFNQLTSLTPISTLTALQHLDLSANQIATLEGVDRLEGLRDLNLAGNCIIELDSLLPLSSLPYLSRLTLSLPGSSLTNPVCNHHSYNRYVKDSLPCLEWLDGEKVGGVGAEFYNKCRAVENNCSSLVTNEGDDSLPHSTYYQGALPDPLKDVGGDRATEDDDIMSHLLSECTDTSNKIQRHIQELQKLLPEQTS